ncbi:MAG: DEAD/DEAH box helicase [Nitrospirae bacterium]|nr:DEAD/DEAH box helicase [Nitrospirota bacterium]
MKIELKSDVRFKTQEMPLYVLESLERRLTLPNLAYLDAVKYGRYVGNVEPELSYIKYSGDWCILPRGVIYQVTGILKAYHIEYTIENHTTKFKPCRFEFTGKLHRYQKEALDVILSKEYGVLQAATGSGKTVIALAAIAKRAQPTLIVVHTKELLYQWQARAMQYLNLDKDEIGLIGDGHKRPGLLTIGLKQTLIRMIDNIGDRYGFIIVDECHHTPASTFVDVVGRLSSAYLIGLSATPYRKDRLTRVIYFYLGDLVHTIETAGLHDSGHILKATLEVIETDFDYDYADDYSSMISELVQDEARNDLILEAVLGQVQADKGIALILSDRKSHCRYLYNRLMGQGVKAALLLGDTGKKERAVIVDGLRGREYRVLVATASLIGEGFDLPDISSIFLIVPIKFSGRLTQYVGRILRTAAGKTEARVFDFIDQNPVLQHSFRSRLYAYKKMGIETETACVGVGQ